MRKRFFNVAFKQSLNGQHKHKVGAVLVKGGSVISAGFNKMRSISYGTKFGYWEGSVHAELDCLSGVDKSVSCGCDLYVFRSHKNGNIALSKPCNPCLAFISSMGIKRVFYSDPNEEKGYGVIKL